MVSKGVHCKDFLRQVSKGFHSQTSMVSKGVHRGVLKARSLRESKTSTGYLEVSKGVLLTALWGSHKFLSVAKN